MKTLTRAVALSLLIAVTGLALVTSTGVSQDDQPLDGVFIEQANASWTSAAPVTNAFAAMLEELGAEVQIQQFSSNGLAYQAIELGDLDFWANGWFPLHNPQLPGGRDSFVESTTIFDPHCPNCGLQGYLIDSASIEEYEITSLQDFIGNDELKQAFDENGDGKADIFGCPPGWGCHGVISSHMEMYEGFSETFNHVTASYPANFSTAQARIQNDQPALYYTWTPNFTTVELTPGDQVKWVSVVENRDELQLAPSQEELSKDAVIAEGLGDAAATDPTYLGFVAADINVVANNDFLSNNPAAEELFKQVRLPLAWVNEATAAIQNEDADPAELAAQWIEDNRDTVDEWLNAARGAASGM